MARRGWNDPDGPPKVRASQNESAGSGQTVVVKFTDDPRRVEALSAWRAIWDDWANQERPAREVTRVYERLYALLNKLDREGGRFELVVGDGILSWQHPDGLDISHPVLIQSVQLAFKPEIKEFSITQSGGDAELYTALFNSMTSVDARAIGRWWDKRKQDEVQPFGGAETSGFLTGLVQLLSSRGMFREDAAISASSEDPQIAREQVLFLHKRSLGMSAALGKAIQDLDEREDLPQSLLAIVDAESTDRHEGSRETGKEVAKEAKEILFAKHSNAEQRRIAERLDQHGSVLVQGPPGTGKTHTIANLIGHLLARGESVMVTSHTTKVLRVLRNHVVPSLQTLCVSVLGSDIETRSELQASVQAINNRLSNPDDDFLEAAAEQLSSRLGAAKSGSWRSTRRTAQGTL